MIRIKQYSKVSRRASLVLQLSTQVSWTRSLPLPVLTEVRF